MQWRWWIQRERDIRGGRTAWHIIWHFKFPELFSLIAIAEGAGLSFDVDMHVQRNCLLLHGSFGSTTSGGAANDRLEVDPCRWLKLIVLVNTCNQTCQKANCGRKKKKNSMFLLLRQYSHFQWLQVQQVLQMGPFWKVKLLGFSKWRLRLDANVENRCEVVHWNVPVASSLHLNTGADVCSSQPLT